MKTLMISLMLVVACVLVFAVSGCTGTCDQEDRDTCQAQHSDCVDYCDPLSANYTECVHDCNDDLNQCLDDHGCS